MNILIEHKFELIDTRRSIMRITNICVSQYPKPLADGSYRYTLYATQDDGTLIKEEITGKGVTIFVNQSEEKPKKSKSNRTINSIDDM